MLPASPSPQKISTRSRINCRYHAPQYTTWEISIQMIEDIKESHSMLALELLRYFSFMHFDGMHPLFHEWSPDRLPYEQHLETWANTIRLTLAISYCFPTAATKRLIPHIEACLSQGKNELLAYVPSPPKQLPD